MSTPDTIGVVALIAIAVALSAVAVKLFVWPAVPVLYERYLAWLKAKAAGK